MRTLLKALQQAPDRWSTPASPGPWTAVPALLAGILVAALLPAAPRPGVNLTISGLILAAPLLLLLRREGRRRGRPRPIGYAAGILATLAIALTAVATVRATMWLSLACAFAGLCLLLAVLLDLRRWDAVLAGPWLFVQAVRRSLPWAGRDLWRGEGPAVSRPVVTGAGVGIGLMVAVGALLSSADPAYAKVLSLLVPGTDLLPVRSVVFVLTVLIFLGGAFAASSRRRWKPASAAPRPVAEWLIPIVLVAATIATFLAVEASTLFGGANVVRLSGDLTHAARARQGFGQLCVVTILVLGLLAWAGASSAQGSSPRQGSSPGQDSGAGSAGLGKHRRWMGMAGGALLGLTLLLAGSALRRLALYQQEYGWTVARLNAGSFEIWLVLVLLAAAGAWLARRVDLLPRLVMGSAALGLLVVALASPDALVARADVTRFEQTGRIDLWYLRGLSDDAVPALDRLPYNQRSCVLAGHAAAQDPVLGWNLSRARAGRLLPEQPPALPSSGCEL